MNTNQEFMNMKAERDALAAQLQETRGTLAGIVDADWRKWEELASPDEFVRWAKSRANHAISKDDTSAAILARRDAAVWMEAAGKVDHIYKKGGGTYGDYLRAKADELLKGIGK